MAVGKIWYVCEKRQEEEASYLHPTFLFHRLAMKIKFIVIYFRNNLHHEQRNLSGGEILLTSWTFGIIFPCSTFCYFLFQFTDGQ